MKRKPTWRRRRLRTETLEPRCMLDATPLNIAGYLWDPATGDLDDSGTLTRYDLVTYEGENVIWDGDSSGTIQAAIDAAPDGGTVYIAPGIYFEDLAVSKSITLAPEPGFDEPVVIDGDGNPGVNIGLNDVPITVNVTGIAITGASEGIRVDGLVDLTSVVLTDVEFVDNGAGAMIHSGDLLVTGSYFHDNGNGVEVLDYGVGTVTQSKIADSNYAGVLVEDGGAVKLTDNPLGISGGVHGVMCGGGGILMSETTTFYGSEDSGIRLYGGVYDLAVADLGQNEDGVDFTGLGVSSGGNDFSAYTSPLGPFAIDDWSSDPTLLGDIGPRGLPPTGNDTPAFNNIFFSDDPLQIETVIWHDGDRPLPFLPPDNSLAFVDYVDLYGLELGVTEEPDGAGKVAILNGSFLNSPQIHTVEILWGDGESSEVTLNQGVFNFEEMHPYSDTGDYTIRVVVTDQMGTVISATSAAPIITDITGGTGVEGSTLTFGAVATDPEDDTLTYTWDFGGGDQVVGPTASYLYADNGDYPVTLTVTDAFGRFATETFTASVANVAPAVAILGAPAEGEEGVPVDLSSSVTDPGVLDTFTYAWSVTKDGAPFATGSDATFSFTPDDNGYYVVTLEVDDGDDVGSDSVVIDISNEPPVITVDDASVNVDEGATATNSGTFLDVDLDEVTITASMGTVTKTGSSSGDWNWTWDAVDGPYAAVVTITADDFQGGATSITFDLDVANVAPTLDDATVAVEENTENGVLVGQVEGTDPGDDTLTYSIVGGDGATAFAIDPVTGEITVADSAQLDYEYTDAYTLEVRVTDEDGAVDTAAVAVSLINRPSISGAVFIDVNENGVYDGSEPAVDNVMIELLDETGAPVLDGQGNPITAVTDGGFYLFEDLPAGTYRIAENQITGLDDGPELLGTLGGSIPANDVMQVALETTDAQDYVFAEIGQDVESGDTASVSFWNGRRGRNLITAGGEQLVQWLTTNFSNILGDSLDGADGRDVYDFFRRELFRQRGLLSFISSRIDAEYFSLALSTYFTSSDLAGDLGADYGLNVTQTGIGTKVVNVGILGNAFGVDNYTDMTIWQVLQATNNMTDVSDNESGYVHIYDVNGDGSTSLSELLLQVEAYIFYRSIT